MTLLFFNTARQAFVKLKVAASSYSTYYYICKTVLSLFSSSAYTADSLLHPAPQAHNSYPFHSALVCSFRQTDIPPSSLYLPAAIQTFVKICLYQTTLSLQNK